MSKNTFGSFANPTSDPPLSLETLSIIMCNFTDRRPAVPREVRVHPDFLDVFIGNLREEGFVIAKDIHPFNGLPVVTDPEVPFGETRLMYQHGLCSIEGEYS